MRHTNGSGLLLAGSWPSSRLLAKCESANRLLEQIAAQTDTVEGNEVANSGYIDTVADREKIEPEINLIQPDPIGLLRFPAAADMSLWRATAFRAKWSRKGRAG